MTLLSRGDSRDPNRLYVSTIRCLWADLEGEPTPFFLQGPGRLLAVENRMSLTSQSVIRVIRPISVVCD